LLEQGLRATTRAPPVRVLQADDHRAIYVVRRDGVEFVSIEEVHKHEY
jgi:hypothetical protein